MKTVTVWLDALTVGKRMRQVDASKVDALAQSMKELGLQQPVTVYSVPDADGGPEDVILIAGLHRVEAAKKLGWETIEAFDVDMSERRRRMWEISENLHRVGLTKVQRDEHIRLYAQLLEEERAEQEVNSRQSVAGCESMPKRPGPKPGVARQIADETGLSKRTVERVLTPPKPRPISPPSEPLNDHEADSKAKGRLIAAWNAAPPEIRQWFREWIDTPVMDRESA